MKNGKTMRVVTMLLMLLMVATFVACSSNNIDDGKDKEKVVEMAALENHEVNTTEVVESGESWASTLKLKETKLLIWNDVTGKKLVIDENVEYTLQEGEQIAIYYPQGYSCTYLDSNECSSFISVISEDVGNLAEIVYELPEKSTKVDINVTIEKDDSQKDSTFYIITP